MIKVLSSGIYTAIQDLGRTGYRHFGIPTAGAMDSYAAKFANLVLNNHENDALIEIVYGRSKFEFLENCTICISGADFSPSIQGIHTEMHKPIPIKKGAVLSFGKRHFGTRTYIAVSGGILTQKVLGSRSFSKGITPKISLEKGDQIPILKSLQKTPTTGAKIKFNTFYLESNSIEVHKGPEYHLLSDKQKHLVQELRFSISANHSRMGYILNEKLPNKLSSMLSSGVLPGTVQLTPSGTLIILMRDCQVTGGYPRVLQLTRPSINILSQKTTGEHIVFKMTS